MRRPTVLILAESLDSAARGLLAEKLGSSFSVIESPECEGWTSRQFASFVQTLPEGAADIVLVGCGGQDARQHVTLDEYQINLRAVIARARKIGSAILWHGLRSDEDVEISFNRAASEIMDAEGVTTADFPGFIRNLAAASPGKSLPAGEIVRVRTAAFFAEALGQWWSVCARTNPAVVRTRLWPGPPPDFRRNGAERINSHGRVECVSEPEITRFHPEVRGGKTAIIVFPGGGYGFMGFLRNARELAAQLAPKDIPVFGLKYRTGRGAEVPLLDAARAVRWVRSHAAEWGIDPHRIGVAGISAGAHLALSLATNWADGDPHATDPVERVSSRPDFVAAFSTWNFGITDSPFIFGSDVPPIFLRHARDDPAFALAEKVVEQLQAAKVPHHARFLDRGGHGAFDLAPGNPGADWPDDFLAWSTKILSIPHGVRDDGNNGSLS